MGLPGPLPAIVEPEKSKMLRSRVHQGIVFLLVLFRPETPWRLKSHRGRFVMVHEEIRDGMQFSLPLPGDVHV